MTKGNPLGGGLRSPVRPRRKPPTPSFTPTEETVAPAATAQRRLLTFRPRMPALPRPSASEGTGRVTLRLKIRSPMLRRIAGR